jgi:hypothetical protein
MTGAHVARTDTSRRQRSVRWVLQALLVVVAAHVAVAFVFSAVVPLALDSPVRRLSTPRGRLLGLAGRALCLVVAGIQASYLTAGVAAIAATLVAAATQSALVFCAAYVVSRLLSARSARS